MGSFKVKSKKIEVIFRNNNDYLWSKSHSWVPTVFPKIINSKLIILYGSRNKSNLTQTGYFIYNLDTKKIFYNTKKPIIKLGKTGSFDDSLALATSALNIKNKTLIYYVGWTRPHNTRFFPSIGIAEIKKDLKKIKKIDYPIISRDKNNIYGCTSPFVLKEKKLFKMWYVSIKRWITKKKETLPIYNVNYSVSVDGFKWKNTQENILKNSSKEIISRPFIFKYESEYHMWYSKKNLNSNFKIEYATSKDGLNWKKNKNFKLPNSKWNSEMTCYPCVFKFKNEFFMLFNGNNYGKNGIGLVKLEYEKK